MENVSNIKVAELPLNVSDIRVTSASGVPMLKGGHLEATDMRIRSAQTVEMPQDTKLDVTDPRIRSAQRMSEAPDTKLDATDKRVRSHEGSSNIEDGVIGNQSNAEFSAPAEDFPHTKIEPNPFKAITEEDYKENFAYAVASEAMIDNIIRADTRDNSLLIYDEPMGYFKRWTKKIFPRWLRQAFSGRPAEKRLSRRMAEDVFDRIVATPSIEDALEDFAPEQPFLNVLNGVVDIQNGKLLEHSPEYRFTSVIHANYLGKKANAPRKFNAMLDGWFPDTPDGRQQLLECLAYLFSEYHTAKVAFYCVGAPNTGKSVLLNLIELMLGDDAVSHVPLEQFGDKHILPTLYGAKVNCYAERDEGGKPLTKTGAFKAYVGGDWLLANPKHLPPFKFKAKGKPIFMSNRPLRIDPRISEDALSQRFIFIEFCNPVKKENRIAVFERVLFTEERDEILTMLVPVLRHWLENGRKFTESEGAKRLMEYLLEQKCSLEEFVESSCRLHPNGFTMIWKLVEEYEWFCEANALEALTPTVFIRDLVEKYHLKKRKKHNLWGIVGIELCKGTEE